MPSHPEPACPLTTAVNTFGDKWHLIVLYALAQRPQQRAGSASRATLAPGAVLAVITPARGRAGTDPRGSERLRARFLGCPSAAEGPVEAAQVVDDELGFLEGGEVPAARHLG